MVNNTKIIISSLIVVVLICIGAYFEGTKKSEETMNYYCEFENKTVYCEANVEEYSSLELNCDYRDETIECNVKV